MRKTLKGITVVLIFLAFLLITSCGYKQDVASTIPAENLITDSQSPLDQNQGNIAGPGSFQSPLPRSTERITKKPFGIFITAQNSPVRPERFRGYHAGADFEIFPEELNEDVPISAVCSGKLVLKKYANGYGGVIAQNCSLNEDEITVIYGHLKLASIAANVGDNIETGDRVGILGADKSAETSGERKHLHLGFHKGSNVNILGYVQNQSELSGWIDPCLHVCDK